MNEILTTGEVAKITGLSQQTIIRCFDSGRLKGFRVPGSKFRRILQVELIAFMKRHGLPSQEFELQMDRSKLRELNQAYRDRIVHLEEEVQRILDCPFDLKAIHAIARRSLGKGIRAKGTR